MKKKLLSIALLLSSAAQASPVTGLFKLSGASMTQAATTAVEVATPVVEVVATEVATPVIEVVAKTAAEIAYEGQVAAAQELATQAAASQAEYAAKLTTEAYNAGMSLDQYQDLLRTPFVEKTGMFQTGWNLTKAVCSAAQDGVTTFGTALVDTVKANPKTSIGLGVAGLAITAAVTYKYNDKLASLRLGAPLFGKSTTNTTTTEQAYTKQVEEAERLAAETKAQQVANDAAIAAELQRQEEVRQAAVTRQAAPVVTALDAEVAALRKYVTEYPVTFNADFFKHVNAANFAHFSKEARDVVFAICQ